LKFFNLFLSARSTAKSITTWMKHYNFTDITIVTPDIHEAFNRQPSFHSAPIEYNTPHDCNLFTESLYTFLRTENPDYTAYHVYSKRVHQWRDPELSVFLKSLSTRSRVVFWCLDPMAIGNQIVKI
jgi:hypothetical protein